MLLPEQFSATPPEALLRAVSLGRIGMDQRVIRALLPKAHFATVYAKPAGKPTVDTFITEVSQDTWILFPWDTEPQFVAPIAKTAAAQ